MNNFMEYFELNFDTVNDIFNHISDDGKINIVFTDVIELIDFLENKKRENNAELDNNQTISMSPLEMDLILKNFEDIVNSKNSADLEELLNGICLMFTVDYEAVNGHGSGPNLFLDFNYIYLYKLIIQNPEMFKKSLEEKLKQKQSMHAQDSVTINLKPIQENDSEDENNINYHHDSSMLGTILNLNFNLIKKVDIRLF